MSCREDTWTLECLGTNPVADVQFVAAASTRLKVPEFRAHKNLGLEAWGFWGKNVLWI